MTGGTVLDSRNAEIEGLRAELAEAKAALARRAEDNLAHYDGASARAAIDGIPGFVAILAPDGAVEAVNRQIMAYCGGTLEDLKTWSLIGIVHDDDLPRVVELFSEAIATGTPYDHELRLRRFDGAYRWFSNRGVPVKDDTGNILRWYVLLTDIDDRKCAEQARTASERNLKLAIDATPAMIWSATPDGHTDSVNQQFVDYTGTTYEQLEAGIWQVVIHPEDHPGMVAIWDRLRAEGEAGQTEARFRRHDGAYRWFLVHAHPMFDDAGKVVRWYGVNADIEDRKKAEQALVASALNLRQTIDAIPTLAWCNNPDGSNEFLNQRWHDYTGLTPEEANGWGWQVTLHPDDLPVLMTKWRYMLDKGEPGELEARLRRHDGVYRWFLFRCDPLRDEAGNVVKWYGTNTDIEDRKQAEEKLARSERNLQETIDAIPIQVICNTITGLYISANQPWHDYTGISPEAAELTGWQQAFHPDDLPALVEGWTRMLRSGIGGDVEGRLRRADGVYRWFLMRSSPLRNDDGKILRWYSTNIDIQLRREMDQALAESEHRLRQTIDTIPTIVLSNNADGANEHISKGWHDYTGLPAEQSVGFGWGDALHPDDQLAMMAKWRAIRTTGESAEVEARVRRHDGVYRWFLFSLASLRDTKGKVLKWYSTVTDIEDRKHAEAELQRAYRDLAEAQRLSSTGSFTNDFYGGTHLWSDELYCIFGFERGTVITQEATLDRIHPDDRDWVRATYGGAARTGQDIDASFRIVLPGGDVRYLHAIGHVSGWQEKHPIIVGAIQDITDTKRAEIALDRARSELTYAARVMSLGVLTASIAHEVNQPLSGIITNANTCQRMLSTDPPNLEGARETLRRTIRDAYRASEVITRLRSLFSKKDFAAESVDLNDAVREVVAMTQDEMRRRRIVVDADLADDISQLIGDRVQLQQVVLNLLLNASDALREVHERPREIFVRTLRDADAVCVSVCDRGPGLSADSEKRIFEPFFTTKENGMGIGLSVSRSIIERHNGKLWVTPNDGPGVTFSFSIPANATAKA